MHVVRLRLLRNVLDEVCSYIEFVTPYGAHRWNAWRIQVVCDCGEIQVVAQYFVGSGVLIYRVRDSHILHFKFVTHTY